MHRVFVLVIVLWMLVGGFAAFPARRLRRRKLQHSRGHPLGGCHGAAQLRRTRDPQGDMQPARIADNPGGPVTVTVTGLSAGFLRLPARTTVLTPDPYPLSTARETNSRAALDTGGRCTPETEERL